MKPDLGARFESYRRKFEAAIESHQHVEILLSLILRGWIKNAERQQKLARRISKEERRELRERISALNSLSQCLSNKPRAIAVKWILGEFFVCTTCESGYQTFFIPEEITNDPEMKELKKLLLNKEIRDILVSRSGRIDRAQELARVLIAA